MTIKTKNIIRPFLLSALAITVILLVPAVAGATPVLLSTFPAEDAFVQPQAVGVDQATGTVYVFDQLGESLQKFDAAGKPMAFSASEPYIHGNEVQPPGEEFAIAGREVEVAVDNSVGGPFSGDIYVSDSGHGFVDVFAPDGTFFGRLNGSGTPQGSFRPCGVAVSPSGDVYVGDVDGFIERYHPVSGTLPVSDADYSVSELSGVERPCAVAVDAAGDVYTSTWPSGPTNEFTQSQFPVSGEATGTPVLVASTSTALAVDPTSDHLLVDEGAQISEFEVSGGLVTPLETFGALSGSSSGIAVNAATGEIYATDEGAQPEATVDVFGAPIPAAPAVAGESAANVTSTSVELHAELNPDFAATSFHFEYGTDTGYGNSLPVPDSALGSGGGVAGLRTVSVHVQDLLPGQTYHYRVVAVNEVNGKTETTDGLDQMFTTSPTGFPLTLLDERGWEMVSPLDKSGADIAGIDSVFSVSNGGIVQASENGEGVTYTSTGAFDDPQGAPLASQYLSIRNPSSWNVENITPPMNSKSAINPATQGGPYKVFSSDLSLSLIDNGIGAVPDTPNLPLTEGAPPTTRYYLRDSAGQLEPVLSATRTLSIKGATPSLNHAVFMMPSTPSTGSELYESTGEELQPINILPGETQPTPGATLGDGELESLQGTHAISENGSRVYFTDGRILYVRKDLNTPDPETIQIGGVKFQTASSDGSVAFATAGGDLYQFDLQSASLIDITTADPTGANVQGVLGASSDGSYVYFVANGVLAPGASLGHCAEVNTNDAEVAPERCSLYVWHNGSTRHIATLSQDDNLSKPKDSPENASRANDWSHEPALLTARVSGDGRGVVFMSDRRLTGYDNTDANTGKADEEVYLYNTETNHLTCTSCNPNGSRPQGPSSIPGGTQYAHEEAIYQSRVLADEGKRVFFDSSDALVPQDTDGQQDVYEWEEDGIGTCGQPEGCVGLISGGTGSSISEFVDASASGDDVFFNTRAQLVPGDTDQLVDLYDARAPHVPGEQVTFPTSPVPSACTGTGCQGVPPTPPIFATPASVTFNGAGNLAPTVVSAKPKAKPPTRAQKLAKALKACHAKRGKKTRTSCEKQARRKYGARSRPKARSKAKKGA